MKRTTVVVALALVATTGAIGGYWLGFRHAWQRALMAEAPVRGAIAIHQLRALEKGQSDNLRISFESDIDLGLMWWAQLEEFPLFDAINTLSGQAVTPDVEEYVRRLATYRKSHTSPLRDPMLVETMLNSVKEKDPDFAAGLEQSGQEGDAAMDRMIEKYAD